VTNVPELEGMVPQLCLKKKKKPLNYTLLNR
jgi:hypothetical protein